MTIPIIHDGKRIGALETRREGAFLRFEARCALLPGVRRLCIFGGGKRAVLGVMQPEGGALVLRRRFSRTAMRTFPDAVEYAGFEERKDADAPPKAETRAEQTPPEGEGFYLTEDGARYLLLPCALRRAVPGTRVREIGGRRWLLFRC